MSKSRAVVSDPITVVSALRTLAESMPSTLAYTALSGERATTATSFTWEELDVRVRSIAAQLQADGAVGQRVLLMCPPGLDYVASFMACLYAGAIAVPVYPMDGGRSRDRLKGILTDATPRFVISLAARLASEQAAARGLEGAASLIWLAADAVEAAASDWQELRPDPAAVAFLQYTSGSTAQPKGVMVTHANLVHNDKLIQELSRSDTHDRVTVSWLPPYHDMGLIGTIIHPVLVGAHSVLMSPLSFMRDPLAWLDAITRYRGTLAGSPNFGYDLCVRRATPERLAKLDLRSWVTAFNGAEPVRTETLERFYKVFEPCGFRRAAITPCYGLAEATLAVTGREQPEMLHVDKEKLEYGLAIEANEAATSLVSSGPVLGDQTVHVVNPETCLPLSPGHVGEIWVKGQSVAVGYWNNEQATEASFRARLADSGDGPYLRTGDLGFFHDGRLFVTGRAKDLIIISGRNHYAHDIERTVEASSDLVRGGAVIAFSVDVEAEERLVLVVGVQVGADKRSSELFGRIRTAVALEHQVDAVAICLVKAASIPKTTSGKLQRRGCRQQYLDGTLPTLATWNQDLHKDYVAPRTELEHQLAVLMADVLAVEKVGVETDFFALGGQSLMAIQVASRVRERFGVELPFSAFIETPTVAGIAVPLQALLDSQQVPLSDAIPRVSRDEPLPLSYAQQRLWFLHQMAPQSPYYNMSGLLKLEGALDIEALRRVFEEIVSRHEVLRTHFEEHDGNATQVIDPVRRWELPIIDLTGLNASAREAEILARAQTEARAPFDLEKSPLLRTTLLRSAADSFVLLVTMHHIAGDGWSMGVVMREIEALYDAFRLGAASPLEPLPVQVADFSVWQREWLKGDVLSRQLSYWTEQLAGCVTLELPTDRERPRLSAHKGKRHAFRIDAALTNDLRSLAQAQSTTLFVPLAAAFQGLLGHIADQEDVVIGTAVANRNRREVEPLIGFFANTLPLRVDLSGDPSFAQVIARVKAVVNGALSNQDIPLDRLVDELKLPRDASRNPLFQVALVLQSAPTWAPVLSGLAVEAMESETNSAKFDLALELTEEADTLRGVLEFDVELFDAETAANLAEQLVTLLRNAAADPDASLSALCAPRAEVVESELTAHFRGLVERAPDTIVLEESGRTINASELYQRALSLAAGLRALDLPEGTGTAIALWGEPSVTTAAGLLGIWLAGHVALPLDPRDPARVLSRNIASEKAAAIVGEAPQAIELAKLLGLPLVHGALEPTAADLSVPSIDALAAVFIVGSHRVEHTHAALARSTAWFADALALHAETKLAWHTSLSSLSGVWELVAALSARGVALVGATSTRDCAALRLDIEDLPALLKSAEDATSHPARVLVIGVQPPEQELRALASAWHSNVRVAVALVEAGGAVLERQLTAASYQATQAIHVVNKAGRRVAAGARGSIVVDGSVNTDTGLIGRVSTSGQVVVEGVRPGSAVVRGALVALSDVEALAREIPGVDDVAVLARIDELGHTRVIAYVVVQSGVALNAIAPQLALVAPALLQPSDVVPVSRLPLTPAGSIDARELATVAVLNEPVLTRAGAEVRRASAAESVAVGVRPIQDELPLLHVSDLLPSWRRVSRGDATTRELPSEAKADAPTKSTVPAVSNGPALTLPDEGLATLADCLRRTAEHHPDRGTTYLETERGSWHQSYPELLEAARQIVGSLRQLGVAPGDKLLFQLSGNEDFLSVFWGCQLGGFVPALASVPKLLSETHPDVTRLVSAWRMLGKPLVVTTRAHAAPLSRLAERMGLEGFRAIAAEELRVGPVDLVQHPSAPDDLALLLLTSGSTGVPKAVTQTHRALLAHGQAMLQLFGFGPDDVTFNWMPMSHVGGIALVHLVNVRAGSHQIHAPTEDILAEPLRWIDGMARFKATWTWAPNFAFGLVNACADELRERTWDLSHLRFVFNGGEAVVPRTGRRFLELLVPFGLSPRALVPVWGMSETCSGSIYNQDFSLETTSDTETFAPVGLPIAGLQLRIVDEQGVVACDGELGQLEARGAIVTRGYFDNPEKNAEAFTADGWFRTGDVGILRDGKLTLMGREKAEIIVDGVNYHSHELEAVAEEVPGVARSFTAACPVRLPGADSERLALFFHPTQADDDLALTKLLFAVRAKLIESCGINPALLVPVTEEQIPKTDIGKIQRKQLSARLVQGDFDAALKRVDRLLRNENNVPDWHYCRAWRPRTLAGRGLATQNDGLTLVFDEGSGLGSAVAASLGGRCVRVVTDGAQPALPNTYRIDLQQPDAYQRLLAELQEPVRRVIHLWPTVDCEPTTTSSLQSTQGRGLLSVLGLVQALDALGGPAQALPLLVATSGMQPVRGAQAGASAHATLIGLLRTLQAEVAWVEPRLVDLDPAAAVDERAQIITAELDAVGGEVEVAYRGQERLVPVLTPAALSASKVDSPASLSGLVVITGGLGGIGLRLAEHLLASQRVSLLLVGRTPLTAAATNERAAERLRGLDALKAKGVVEYRSLDICDPHALRSAIDETEALLGVRLSTVFHLAGDADMSTHWKHAEERWLVRESGAALEQTMRAKVLGTLAIHEALAQRNDVRYVAFSSANGLFGGASVGAYSAASSFIAVDALQRRAAGMASTCFTTSQWDQIGMSRGNPEGAVRAAQALGYRVITPEQGMLAIDAALQRDLPELIVGLDRTRAHVGRHLDAGRVAVERLQAYVESPEPRTDSIELVDAFGTRVECELAAVPKLFVREDGTPDFERLSRAAGTRAREHGVSPRTDTERQLVQIFQKVLGSDTRVGVRDNFFDLGVDSLRLTKAFGLIKGQWPVGLSLVDLFTYTTIEKLAAYILDSSAPDVVAPRPSQANQGALIAIVGMAGRFPKAESVRELWDALLAGRDSLTRLTDEEILASGVDKSVLDDPLYVKLQNVLEGVDHFDAAFFDVPAREAERLDPQHRFGLECAWAALEDAGYTPESSAGPVAVFAGAGISSYMLRNLWPTTDITGSTLELLSFVDKDFMSTRIAYKLNLKGPALGIDTACSSSLVATHLAIQSLRSDECRMALVGGSQIAPPETKGYLWREGAYESADGVCRPFDVNAKGMVNGSGAAFVVLKRLDDAVEDRDHIYAVIRGSAINNDGSSKIGFTAPSVSGQTAVVTSALLASGVHPESIKFVEAHGTGTTLGDPIEARALMQAYRAFTTKRGFCALGSVKSNIGHTGSAAGVTGLIKAALSLEHRVYPKTLHFTAPNPKLDWTDSPLYVADRPITWRESAEPARAGVSSLGIGGTNAHVILEEPPRAAASLPSSRPYQLLLLSAKNSDSLERMTGNLRAFLRSEPAVDLADAAYTLQIGRRSFAERRAFVVDIRDENSRELSVRCAEGRAHETPPQCIFQFPGGGTQYVRMAQGIFEHEPVFREHWQRAADCIKAELGVDLTELLYDQRDDNLTEREAVLRRTSVALPAIFAVEYALAQLWMSWGVKPQAMIGHSLGEYTAATLAGVIEFSDAMRLVCLRGRLIETLAEGAMLSVPLSEQELSAIMPAGLSLAAVNGPQACVASGTPADIDELEARLAARDIEARRVNLATAGHSRVVEPILDELYRLVSSFVLRAPQIPYVSNVTGTWITESECTDPSYWVRHLRQTVRYAQGLETLLAQGPSLLLEVGPGTVLSSLARWQIEDTDHRAVASLRHVRETRDDEQVLAEALGKVWASGASVDFNAVHAAEPRRRISLPGYAFDRKPYWIDAKLDERKETSATNAKLPLDRWFWAPSWRRSAAVAAVPALTDAALVLMLGDGEGLASQLTAALEALGMEVVRVRSGSSCVVSGAQPWQVRADHRADFEALVAALPRMPAHVVHLLGVGEDVQHEQDPYVLHVSLIELARALGARGIDQALQLTVATTHRESVTGIERLDPRRALVVGPTRVIPYEYPTVGMRLIDLDPDPAARGAGVALLADEIAGQPEEREVAFRGKTRFVRSPAQFPIAGASGHRDRLHAGGVYLVTGGLGGMGYAIAQELSLSRAKLILVQRRELPEREQWRDKIADPSTGRELKESLEKLVALEDAGAEVFVVCADVADGGRLASGIGAARDRFGSIQGVFHAAGLSDTTLIQAADRALTERVLSPKVAGTDNLWSLVAKDEPDFFLLFSSFSANTTIYGGADYVSANAYEDAFARAHAGHRTFVCSIGWDIWDEVGMAMTQGLSTGDRFIATAEGVEVVRRILRQGAPEVIVSTRDFSMIMARTQAVYGSQLGTPQQSQEPSPQAKAKYYDRPELRTPYAPPQNDVEATVVRIWEETLRVQPVGIHDNFFELGGESVLSVQILSKLKQAGHALTAQAMFQGPTVHEIAQRVVPTRPDDNAAQAKPRASERRAKLTAADVPLARLTDAQLQSVLSRYESVEDIYRTSPLQAIMLREGAKPSVHRSYVTQAVLEVTGVLRVDHFQAAFDAVVARFATLRSAFVEIDNDEPVHVVCRTASSRIEEADWSGLDEPGVQETLSAFLRADRARGFDLAQAPLMRMTIARAPGRHIAVLTNHQAVLDGWSAHIFVADLFRALIAVQGAQTPIFSDPVIVQPRDFIEWLHEQDEPVALRYWSRLFKGVRPVRHLRKLERASAAMVLEPYGDHQIELSSEATLALNRLARTQRITLNTLVQAAWAVALGRVSGDRDIVFGVTVAGRPEELTDVSVLVGQCSNSLPLRVRIPDELSHDWLRELQHENSALRAHGYVGLDQIRAELGAGDGFLYDTNLIFESVPGGSELGTHANGLQFAVRATSWREGWHFPLRVFVFPSDPLAIRVTYDRTRFVDTQIKELARAFARVLESLGGVGARPTQDASVDAE